jgi:hypothetical protein
MDALDGNSSGKKRFHETISKVRAFQKQVNLEAGADSPASVRELVTNMTSLRKKIMNLFGPTACKMHGLNPETAF